MFHPLLLFLGQKHWFFFRDRCNAGFSQFFNHGFVFVLRDRFGFFRRVSVFQILPHVMREQDNRERQQDVDEYIIPHGIGCVMDIAK